MPSDVLAHQFDYDAWYKQVVKAQQRKARLYTLKRGDGTIEEVGDGFDILFRRQDSTRDAIFRAEQQWRRHLEEILGRSVAKTNAVEDRQKRLQTQLQADTAAPVAASETRQETASTLCAAWSEWINDQERRGRREVGRHRCAVLESLSTELHRGIADIMRRHPRHDTRWQLHEARKQDLLISEQNDRMSREEAERQVRSALAAKAAAALADLTRKTDAKRYRVQEVVSLSQRCLVDEAKERQEIERVQLVFLKAITQSRTSFSARHRDALAKAWESNVANTTQQLRCVEVEERHLRDGIVQAGLGFGRQLKDRLDAAVTAIEQPPPPLPEWSDVVDEIMKDQASGRRSIRQAAEAWLQNVLENHQHFLEEYSRLEVLKKQKVEAYFSRLFCRLVAAETSAREDIESRFDSWWLHLDDLEENQSMTASVRYAPPPPSAAAQEQVRISAALFMKISGEEERIRGAIEDSEWQWRHHILRQARQLLNARGKDMSKQLAEVEKMEHQNRSQILLAEERWRSHLLTKLTMLRHPDPS